MRVFVKCLGELLVSLSIFVDVTNHKCPCHNHVRCYSGFPSSTLRSAAFLGSREVFGGTLCVTKDYVDT
jgi:hypothetical protein